MNEMPKRGAIARTTQAAEGLPRWRWTTAELQRLAELGAFADNDKFELLGGEIVPISPKGRRHEVLREMIEERMRRALPTDVKLIAEPQFNLSSDTYTEPDLLVYPARLKAYDVAGTDALLVVEIAASSWDKDIGTKALAYAAHGVRDYWVIDAATLVTRIHRNPTPQGYGEFIEVPADRIAEPLIVPSLALRMVELDAD